MPIDRILSGRALDTRQHLDLAGSQATFNEVLQACRGTASARLQSHVHVAFVLDAKRAHPGRSGVEPLSNLFSAVTLAVFENPRVLVVIVLAGRRLPLQPR